MNRALSAHGILVDLPRRISEGEIIDLEPIEKEFFYRLKNSNGVYKATNKYRLDDVNRALAALIAPDIARNFEILDVAASSGITSLRWMELLREGGFTARMTISDLTVFGYLLTPVPWFRVLVDRHGIPLEFELFYRPVPVRFRKLDFVTGKIIVILVARVLHRSFGLDRPDKRPCDTERPIGERRGPTLQKLPLVSAEVRRHSEVRVIEDDIMAGNPEELTRKFDVIRAANILQACYFDECSIRKGLAHLKARLRGDGAWLVICRTHDDGGNHASIFRLEGDRFLVKSRIGNGSEVEALVLES